MTLPPHYIYPGSFPGLQHDHYSDRGDESSPQPQGPSRNAMEYTITTMNNHPHPAGMLYTDKTTLPFEAQPQYSAISRHCSTPRSSSMSDNNSTASLFSSSDLTDFRPYLSPNEVQSTSRVQSPTNLGEFTPHDNTSSFFPSQYSFPSKQIQPLTGELMSPILTGMTDNYQSHHCGPNAARASLGGISMVDHYTSMPRSTPAEDLRTVDLTSPPTYLDHSNSVDTFDYSQHSSNKRSITPQHRQGSQEEARDPKQRAKHAHSLIERKYRENLNTKFAQLHSVLKESHCGHRVTNADGVDDASSNINRIRKGDVLADAVNYVHHTEVEVRHMEAELQRLRYRVQQLEQLTQCENCLLIKEMVAIHTAPV